LARRVRISLLLYSFKFKLFFNSIQFNLNQLGANISKITADYPNTHVKFVADNRITLDGPPDEVERVRERLQNITIGLKQNMVCEELIVDVKYHSQLVGKKYENVNRINKEYGVLVRVPDAPQPGNNKSSTPSNVIRIEGAPDSVARAKADLTELIKRLENERSKDIIIEQKYHSTLIGKNGKNLNEIRNKFNSIQINIPTVEEKSDIVTIRGNKVEVEKCFLYLNKIIKEMQESNYQDEIHIFKEFHKLIIGKQGAFIRKIKDETQTRIDVPNEDSDSDKVIITGRQENVLRARKMIEDKVKELVKIEEDHVDIPHNLHTALIGKGGIIIKQIRRECGNVLINFPAENQSSDNKITLKGPREDINKAKQELLKLAKEKNDISYSDEIHAKLEYHKFLVGKKGTHINSLKDKYNVRIIFPSSSHGDVASQKDNNNNSGNAITIIGKEENVKAAKSELEATIRTLDEQIIDHVTVDPKWHKLFTSRRGKLINKISDDNCNVSISFPKLSQTTSDDSLTTTTATTTSDSVTLKGPRDAVDAAKKKILEVVHDLDNQVTIDINVPQKYHVTIIGKKGANSQQISDTYKVEIHFPAKSINDKRGQQQRQQQQQQQQNHHQNSSKTNSPGGIVQDEDSTNDDDVVLTNGTSPASSTTELSNSHSSKSDIIQITGLRENCEKAKEAILELLPISEDYPFPSTFHRDLLSNKAEILRQLTDTHNVQINVPKRNDENNDFLNIVGSKENVASAKVAIQECLADFERKNFRVEIVDFNPEFIPQMRGRNGKEIQNLEKKYNVRIDMSRKGEPDKIVIKVLDLLLL
jgi:transcription antitermination factor NusA-like protein